MLLTWSVPHPRSLEGIRQLPVLLVVEKWKVVGGAPRGQRTSPTEEPGWSCCGLLWRSVPGKDGWRCGSASQMALRRELALARLHFPSTEPPKITSKLQDTAKVRNAWDEQFAYHTSLEADCFVDGSMLRYCQKMTELWPASSVHVPQRDIT